MAAVGAAATPLHVALGTWLTSMGYKPQVLSKICTESASYAMVCTKHVWCTGCTENGTIWSFDEVVLCTWECTTGPVRVSGLSVTRRPEDVD